VFGVKTGANLTLNNLTVRDGRIGVGIIVGSPVGFWGHGGGIFNSGGTVTLTNSTVSNNSISNANGNGEDSGGGIYNWSSSGTVKARNTIIAGNSVPGGPGTHQGPDFWGSLTSLGSNLIGNTADMSGTVSGDIINQPANLAPLANNGGPTRTNALLSNSPAINAGNDCVLTNNGCGDGNAALTADQRGQNRKYGSKVDIGAFELQADSDADGVEDFRDNCPNTSNPDQSDTDGNGIGDVCEDSTPPVITPTVRHRNSRQ
jgi:hypothetical protein